MCAAGQRIAAERKAVEAKCRHLEANEAAHKATEAAKVAAAVAAAAGAQMPAPATRAGTVTEWRCQEQVRKERWLLSPAEMYERATADAEEGRGAGDTKRLKQLKEHINREHRYSKHVVRMAEEFGWDIIAFHIFFGFRFHSNLYIIYG
jgi:hypothetical protein